MPQNRSVEEISSKLKNRELTLTDCFLAPPIALSDVTEEAFVTYRHLIAAFKADLIQPYTHNRGAQGISSSRVRKIADNFKPESFGSLPIEIDEYDNLTQFGSHHRCAGLMVAYDNGKIPDKVLDLPVSVTLIQHGFGQAWYTCEGSAKGHTSRNKFTNPDTGLGDLLTNKILARVRLPVGSKPKDLVQTKHFNAIVYCLLAVETRSVKEWADLSYIDVSNNRKTGIAYLQDLTPQELANKRPISSTTITELVMALTYVYEVFAELLKKEANESLTKVISRGEFFGYMLWSKLKGTSFTRSGAKLVADKISKKNDSVLKYSSSIRNNKSIERLDDLLNQKL